MRPFNFTKTQFLAHYPQFQGEVQHGHFCRFDDEERLVEACFFQRSRLLQRDVKYRSILVDDESITTTYGDFKQVWRGQKGTVAYEDKDRNIIEVEWRRESKLKELIEELLAANPNEVDEDLKRKADWSKREEDFNPKNFRNWPSHLTENRFLTWQSLNPNLNASDFQKFFDEVDQSLSEDQLGASLTKWLRNRS